MEFSQQSSSRIRGQVIKAYRETYDKDRLLTQEELAERLSKDARTLRAWEQGEVLFIRPQNARALHQAIGIPLQLLGLEDWIEPEEAEQLHRRNFSLLEHGAYIGALKTSELLIQQFALAKKRGQKMQGFILPAAYHTLGLATATLKNDPEQAEAAFKKMQRALKELKESSNTDILALTATLVGDMKRRQGKYVEAQQLLEEVLEDMLPDEKYVGIKAHIAGNCMQMLARVHLEQIKREKHKTHETAAFYYLRKAEELAQPIVQPEEQNYYHCFCPLSVKAEFVKSLILTGQYDKGFDELTKMKKLAENASPRWSVLAYIKEGEFLMQFGQIHKDASMIRQGEISLRQGYKQAHKFSHLRQIKYVRGIIQQWQTNAIASQERLQMLSGSLDHIDEEN